MNEVEGSQGGKFSNEFESISDKEKKKNIFPICAAFTSICSLFAALNVDGWKSENCGKRILSFLQIKL